MNQNKTKPSNESVDAYLGSISDPDRRNDTIALASMMQQVTGEKPELWGGNMIGFGRYHYRYDSGREGEWLATGFAPRARELVVYLMADAPEREQLLDRLGKHRSGKSCLYIKRLSDIDTDVLESLIRSSQEALRKRYPER